MDAGGIDGLGWVELTQFFMMKDHAVAEDGKILVSIILDRY